jgi:hypothetical protein
LIDESEQPDCQSMIPKSGTGFRKKIMLKQKLDHDPIQLDRIMV